MKEKFATSEGRSQKGFFDDWRDIFGLYGGFYEVYIAVERGSELMGDGCEEMIFVFVVIFESHKKISLGGITEDEDNVIFAVLLDEGDFDFNGLFLRIGLV